MNSNIELLKKFLDKCSDFEKDLEFELDSKHNEIVSKSHRIINNNLLEFVNNFKDWDGQGDFGAPSQLTFDHFKILGIKKYFKNLIKLLFFLEDVDFKRSFFDDLHILKSNNAFELLKKNPVHKTPGCKDFYKFKGTSTNYRWNRYAYQASQIINFDLLKKNYTCLNIGSYYGGLESFLYNYNKNCKYYLVDFNHQLLRSFIFLSKVFPNENHVLPDDITHSSGDVLKPGFYYLPIQKFFKTKINVDLFINSFSFGEMTNQDFDSYLNSENYINAKYIYLINRFVSAPFFEKTYDNNKNVFDYAQTKNFSNIYFDIFPIHHFQIMKRKVFNINAKRPISSPYFEMILKNENRR